jgi:Ran GTPase-activating protein (RanGAP) involved in mRNA processing and transport
MLQLESLPFSFWLRWILFDDVRQLFRLILPVSKYMRLMIYSIKEHSNYPYKNSLITIPKDQTSLEIIKKTLHELVQFRFTNGTQPIYTILLEESTFSIKSLCDQLPSHVNVEVRFLDMKKKHSFDSYVRNILHKLKNNLTTLYMSNNYMNIISSCSLSASLIHNKNIRNITLRKNCFSSEGMVFLGEVISQMHLLETLDISNNKIGIVGCEGLINALSGTPSLTSLNLSNNNLSQFGNDVSGIAIKIIGSSLQQKTKLKTLNLGCNWINFNGAYILADILQYLTQLTDLNIEFNNMSGVGIRSISRVLPKLPLISLNIGGNKFFDMHDCLPLFKSFEHIKGLTYLNLDANNINNIGATILQEYITSLHSLRHLSIKHNDIGNTSATLLVKSLRFTKVETLEFANNSILLSDFFSNLAYLTRLTFLDVSDCTSIAISSDFSKSSNLTSLHIRHNVFDKKSKNNLNKAFAMMPCLSYLDMTGIYLKDEGMAELSNIIKLQSLSTLLIRDNHITDKGVSQIVMYMPFLTNLTHIDISWNQMSKKAFDELSKYKIPICDNYLHS